MASRVRRASAFVGDSPQVREMLAIVDRVARSESTVLIEGESGTGKELIARRIHDRSPRREGPFLAVNTPALADGVFESQLFGHRKGAFTGAEDASEGLAFRARRGTLLLDEISELHLDKQAKLLRLLQEGELLPVGASEPIHVETRFVATTNRVLADSVESGRFREDLYYRLQIAHVRIPPLRERPGDIPILLDHFSRAQAKVFGVPQLVIPPPTMDMLVHYTWPGNVRQMSAWVERLYVTGQCPCELAEELCSGRRGTSAAPVETPQTLSDWERHAIREALRRAKNNRSEAARILNIHRTTLLRKVSEYGL